ncbi:MAG: hypothetical protein NTW69_11395 [Chloroflexi bacterium]|nr:hypothetical protein [Chloroflexota bacterium]
MPFQSIIIVRLCGIAGVLGALIMGTGDLLYHHIPGSKLSLADRMSSFPQKRLVTAGIFGLIGSWLYMLSVFHIYFAFLSVGAGFALSVSFSFTMVAIAYGVAHASYYAIASSAKVARENNLDVEAAGKIGEALFSRVVLVTYIPVAISMLLMLYGVFSGRSAYPIWMVIFLPIVPYLLRIPILKILSGRAHELVRDSYDNFVLLLFFIMSTIVLWNHV